MCLMRIAIISMALCLSLNVAAESGPWGPLSDPLYFFSSDGKIRMLKETCEERNYKAKARIAWKANVITQINPDGEILVGWVEPKIQSQTKTIVTPKTQPNYMPQVDIQVWLTSDWFMANKRNGFLVETSIKSGNQWKRVPLRMFTNYKQNINTLAGAKTGCRVRCSLINKGKCLG